MDSTAAALEAPEFLQRLTKRYRPGHWIGALRKAFGPVAEVSDAPGHEAVESYPPHYLIALWRPLSAESAFLARWPYKVSIVAPDAATAARELLADVAPPARLWMAGPEIDWALMASIVMLGEAGLKPYQYRELQAFIDNERKSTLAAISVNYTGGDDVFEQFVRTDPSGLQRLR
jgi:hypothetical protein